MKEKNTQNGNYSTRRPTTFMNTNEYYDTALKLKMNNADTISDIRAMMHSAYGYDIGRSNCKDAAERYIGDELAHAIKVDIFDNPDSCLWKSENLKYKYEDAHKVYDAISNISKDYKHTEPNVSESRPAAYFHYVYQDEIDDYIKHNWKK